MYHPWRAIALSLLLLPVPARAQTGLLVVAHGANAEWNSQVRETVAQVRWTSGPTAVAFLMGPESESSGWSRGVEQLVSQGARSIVVVPLMVSSHGSHYRQIRFYAGELEQFPPELEAHNHGPNGPPPVPMQVTPALDAAPELQAAVATRWSELEPRLRSAPLVLLGHGPTEDRDALRWVAAFETALGRVRAQGHEQESRPALLRDDAPPPDRARAIAVMRDTVSALAARSGDSVTVMTILIAQGQMTRARIPRAAGAVCSDGTHPASRDRTLDREGGGGGSYSVSRAVRQADGQTVRLLIFEYRISAGPPAPDPAGLPRIFQLCSPPSSP
jgi:sirohydrochlorin ferrochelatase